MEMQCLNRAALGNIANLGDLYDARTDNFCGISVFKKEIPMSALSSVDNHFTDVQVVNSGTISDKMHALDINAELKVSILARLLALSGSGKYLTDKKNRCKTFKRSLLYNITTVTENVNIYAEELRGCFAIDSLQSSIGTHVLVGSSWGANSLITVEYQNTEKKDSKMIEGCLQAQLNLLKIQFSGKAKVDYNDKEESTGINFNIKIFGDILPHDGEIPTTSQEAIRLMKKMPALVKSCNSGKGKPLKYTLIPLDVLFKYLNLASRADIMLKALGDDCVVRVVQIFDNISFVKQQLTDFYNDVLKHTFCLPQSKIKEIHNTTEAFYVAVGKFRSDLSKILPKVRSGAVEMTQLEELIKEYTNSKNSYEKVKLLLTSVDKISVDEKMAFADILVENNVQYIGFGKSLDTAMLKNEDQPQAVLYFTESLKVKSKDTWIDNRLLFYDMIKKGDFILFAVDCDIHPELLPSDGMSIATYKNGKQVCTNLLDKQRSERNISHARCLSPVERLAQKPNNRIELSIICPGIDCNPTEVQDWVCEKCHAFIEYGFDSSFYCSCGKGTAADYEFKCQGSNHGLTYCAFTSNDLAKVLGKLRPLKELNILILGETGVGKSTWINGFFNYLSYESLADAEKNEMLSLIPSQFTMCNDEYEETLVSTGTSADEVQIAGQSATQQTKVYPFLIGDTLIRLIDTPGIGDTRGIDQDKKNFENVLNTLSYLDELHGICILLKPNQARLNIMFTFCIKELLTHLHKDACHNIMFCFTNSRGTFYRPGDTLPALKNLLASHRNALIPLSKHTIYCFDSESYRFLAALKAGMKFSAEEQMNFATSWSRSVDETVRMLQHITGLPPHPIKNTTSLNESRQLILTLAKPLAEISKNIQTNIALVEDKKVEIRKSNLEVDELKKNLFVTQVDLNSNTLLHPRTVCTNSNCIKVYDVGNGIKRNKYEQLCHNPCGLRGVTVDTIGHHDLINCLAMAGENCRHCSHSYKEHMHIMYESEEVNVQIEDENIKSQMSQKLSAAQTKQIAIQGFEHRIKAYRKEQNSIEQTTARFACFLKTNAITPYNDAMLEYMDHQIREEQEKVAAGGDPKIYEGIKATRNGYKLQIDILEKEIAKGGSAKVLKTEEVSDEVDKLLKLHHYGRKLKNALNAARIASCNAGRYTEVTSPISTKNESSIFRIFNGCMVDQVADAGKAIITCGQSFLINKMK